MDPPSCGIQRKAVDTSVRDSGGSGIGEASEEWGAGDGGVSRREVVTFGGKFKGSNRMDDRWERCRTG